MENNKSKTDWSKRDIGALWKREGKSQKYLSGYIKVDELGLEREVKVVIFSNKNKKDNQKAPDYRVYLSETVETKKATDNSAVSKQIKSKKEAKPEVVEESEDIL